MIVRLSLNDQVCEIFTRSFSREKIDVKMFKFVSIRQQKKTEKNTESNEKNNKYRRMETFNLRQHEWK